MRKKSIFRNRSTPTVRRGKHGARQLGVVLDAHRSNCRIALRRTARPTRERVLLPDQQQWLARRGR